MRPNARASLALLLVAALAGCGGASSERHAAVKRDQPRPVIARPVVAPASVEPSRKLGCVAGDPGSAMEPLGPPAPRLVAARRAARGVELRWRFAHPLPRLAACRPYAVLATVAGRATSGQSYTKAVRVRGRQGHTLVRPAGKPPYTATVTSVTAANLGGRHVERPVR